jgi:hypothetical protein
MADNNRLELVIEVDVNKANASIKSINTGLSSMEQAAGKAARGASAGIDGLTISMVKGSAAGNLLADSIKKALDWAKEWTLGAAEHAAHTDKMALSMAALAKAHGVSAEASNRAVEAVKKVGFGTQDAIHAVDRLMVADMNLSKAEGLAKVPGRLPTAPSWRWGHRRASSARCRETDRSWVSSSANRREVSATISGSKARRGHGRPCPDGCAPSYAGDRCQWFLGGTSRRGACRWSTES